MRSFHLTVAALLTSLLALTACDEPQTTSTRSYDVPGAVTVVAVNSHGGAIAVTAGAGDTVRVTETVRHTGPAPVPGHRLDGAQLTFTSGCQGHGGGCGVDYRLEVPATVSLVLDSVGGVITVGGLSGGLDLASGGGAVDASGISSPALTARTAGGASRLEFATPPGIVSVDSAGGDVHARLPAQGYAVDARTEGGGTTIGVAVDPASPHRVDVRTGGGDVVLTAYPGR